MSTDRYHDDNELILESTKIKKKFNKNFYFSCSYGIICSKLHQLCLHVLNLY